MERKQKTLGLNAQQVVAIEDLASPKIRSDIEKGKPYSLSKILSEHYLSVISRFPDRAVEIPPKGRPRKNTNE